MEKIELEEKVILVTKNEQEISSYQDSIFQIVFLGFLTLLTVMSTALLHANEQEFILNRFADINSLELSLFDTTVYLAYFLTGIIVGLLSDRLAKRKFFLIIGSIGAGLLFGLMTVTLRYYVLLILRFLQGCFSIMIWQILMTIILDLSTQKNRGRNMGIYGILLAIGMGLGPMIGGFIAEIGVLLPYYIAAGLMVLVFLLAIFVKEPPTLKERSTLKESINLIKQKPRIIIPSLFNFVDRLHMGFIIFVLPLIIGLSSEEGGLGLGTNYRGIAFGVFALPFIILQYPFGKVSDIIGRYIPIIVGSIFYGLTLSLFGYIGSISYSWLIILLISLGIFSGITSPASMALVGDFIDEGGNNATGMSVFTLFGNIGIALGPFIAGAFLSFGFGLTFLIAGIIEVLCLIINIILISLIFKEKINKTINFRKNIIEESKNV